MQELPSSHTLLLTLSVSPSHSSSTPLQLSTVGVAARQTGRGPTLLQPRLAAQLPLLLEILQAVLLLCWTLHQEQLQTLSVGTHAPALQSKPLGQGLLALQLAVQNEPISPKLLHLGVPAMTPFWQSALTLHGAHREANRGAQRLMTSAPCVVWMHASSLVQLLSPVQNAAQ